MYEVSTKTAVDLTLFSRPDISTIIEGGAYALTPPNKHYSCGNVSTAGFAVAAAWGRMP
jgi:hypothetical protein